MTQMDTRERLSGMLNFAAGLLDARQKAQFRMGDKGAAVWREEVVSGLPGIDLNEDEVWMRVARLHETPPPMVPAPWEPWLKGDIGAPERTPELLSELAVRMTLEEASDAAEAGLCDPEDCVPIMEADTETIALREISDEVMVRLVLARMPEFVAGFADWVESTWLPWAAAEGPRRRSVMVYQELFKLHSKMQSSSTGFELVWGIGIARWRCPDGRVLDAPLIEVLADLELEENGDLTVRPRSVVKPRLAMEPYVELDLPGATALQNDLQGLLERANDDPDGTISPFDATTYLHILEQAVARLTGSAILLRRTETDDDALPVRPDERLTVQESWSLFVRPRSEQVRRDDLKAIAREVDDEAKPLPESLQGFVRDPRPDAVRDEFGFGPGFLESSRRASNVDTTIHTDGHTTVPLREVSVDPDPYFFPLPYNAEQARIIDTLEGQGVAVVQGPPGTGKSHTIANIVAHYMAIGRRVLVTARTAEAISVVQAKLPEDLRRLTISVVHSDRAGARQLEDAVSALARDARSADTDALKEKIVDLEAAIRNTDLAVGDIDARLAEIARENLAEITHCGATMMPMELAEMLTGQAGQHGWFTDRPQTETPPEALVEEIKAARAEVADDLVYLALFGPEGLALPQTGDLPSAAELIAANRMSAGRHARPEEYLADAPLMARDTADAEAQARVLQSELMALEEWLERSGLRAVYARQAAARLAGHTPGGDDPVPQALAALRRFAAATDCLQPRRTCWPALSDPALFWDAVAKLAEGRQPLGWVGGMFRRQLRAELDALRVEGRPAIAEEDWRAALHDRRWREAFDALRAAWPDVLLPALPVDEPDPQRAAQAINAIRADLQWLEKRADEAPDLRERLLRLFPYGLSPVDTLARGEHGTILRALRANLEAVPSRHAALAAMESAAQGATPVHGRMAQLAKSLDGPELPPAQIVEARNALGAELERLHARVPTLRGFTDALSRLDQAGAPDWAARLRAPTRTMDEVLPEDWCDAWIWGAGMRHVEHLLALEDTEALLVRKAELAETRRRLLRETIASRTLLGLAQRAPQFHGPLQMFSQAIRRLGAGTGKQADRWRRQIQAAALEAAPVIPVWIMPEYRVAEQLPRELGDFDLVILDEASQSDITALGALARGKRMLIVGDDEQVSPSAIGLPAEKVTALRSRHLQHLRHGEMIDAESSIFDLAQMLFPAAQVTLREHFRSVAPIIAFSSQFYEGGLVPLRVPKASERLDPPLVDIFIPDGVRDGQHPVNRSEAAVIVDEIAWIIADPAFAGRSIGVISLLGVKQAETIERMLMAHPDIGVEKMRAHRIICGDSATLQGQERDIVLLSMVSDTGSVRLNQTRQTGQRFNVAMSRARDRLYLVRSIDVSDLDPADFRARAIAHFHDPLPEGARLATGDLLDRCQSGFEREVCARLLDAGYRVIPQMPAGAFSIDLVVEGVEDRRLAIELDGDRYHGPDRWHRDMARQAALERAGWVFWRVFGSQWKADPELWWARLQDHLSALGITPIGAAGVADTLTEHRVIKAQEPNKAAMRDEPDMVLEGELVDDQIGGQSSGNPPLSDEQCVYDLPLKASPLDLQRDAEPLRLAGARQRALPSTDKSAAPALTAPIASCALLCDADVPRLTGPQRFALPAPPADPDASASEDELFLRIEAAAPEAVTPGLFVTLRCLDDDSRRTILISEDEHRPADGIIHIDRPLAIALLGAAIGEEVTLSADNITRTLRIEGIGTSDAMAAE